MNQNLNQRRQLTRGLIMIDQKHSHDINTQNTDSVKKQRDTTYRELKTINKHQNPDHYYHLLAKFSELAEQYCALRKGMKS